MTKDKTVEIIYSKKKIFFTMFHPERKNIDQENKYVVKIYKWK